RSPKNHFSKQARFEFNPRVQIPNITYYKIEVHLLAGGRKIGTVKMGSLQNPGNGQSCIKMIGMVIYPRPKIRRKPIVYILLQSWIQSMGRILIELGEIYIQKIATGIDTKTQPPFPGYI